MARNNLRSRIVTGMMILPAVATFVVLLWSVHGVFDMHSWAGLLATGVMTYFLVELNNRNALLRIRSRMIGVTFLCVISALPFLHEWDVSYVPALCLILSFFCLFSSYGERDAGGQVCYAFALVGLGSLFCPQFILIALAFWISMLWQLRTMSLRHFWASLLGLCLPYWIYGAWHVWHSTLMEWLDTLVAQWQFEMPCYQGLPLSVVASFALLAGLTLIALIHYLRTAYNDKIRVRMLYYTIITVLMVVLLALVFHPSDYQVWLRAFVVCCAPLIGHHLSLSRGRGADVWFYVSVLLVVVLGVFNFFDIWNNLFNFS